MAPATNTGLLPAAAAALARTGREVSAGARKDEGEQGRRYHHRHGEEHRDEAIPCLHSTVIARSTATKRSRGSGRQAAGLLPARSRGRSQ
jgi:hypothetical protein